jgi:hypothetical protein
MTTSPPHWVVPLDAIIGEYKKKSFCKIPIIKNIITSKFKKNLWCNKELRDKIKLRYYKEVINPNLEDQKYLSILTRAKKKINIAKIRTNSYALHSETGVLDNSQNTVG